MGCILPSDATDRIPDECSRIIVYDDSAAQLQTDVIPEENVAGTAKSTFETIRGRMALKRKQSGEFVKLGQAAPPAPKETDVDGTVLSHFTDCLDLSMGLSGGFSDSEEDTAAPPAGTQSALRKEGPWLKRSRGKASHSAGGGAAASPQRTKICVSPRGKILQGGRRKGGR